MHQDKFKGKKKKEEEEEKRSGRKVRPKSRAVYTHLAVRFGDAYVSPTNLQTAKGGRAFTVVTQTDQPVLISPVERDDVEKKMLGNKRKAREGEREGERRREKRNRKRRMANDERRSSNKPAGGIATDNLTQPILTRL